MPTGKNKVPMAEFRAVLEKAGLKDVRTYIQTGNAIVRSKMAAREIETIIHRSLKDDMGVDMVAVVKTASQFGKIMGDNPFVEEDTARIYFTLLAEKPKRAAMESFASIDFSPEKVEVRGDVVYTLYATKYSDSKFNNNFFERKLGVAATTRNFNTMTKLLVSAKGDFRHSQDEKI